MKSAIVVGIALLLSGCTAADWAALSQPTYSQPTYYTPPPSTTYRSQPSYTAPSTSTNTNPYAPQNNPYSPAYKGRPFAARGISAMQQNLVNPQFAKSLATGILSHAHPSGKNPSLANYSVIEEPGQVVRVDVIVAWQGGILGTNYQTSARWRFKESGHVGAEITGDNSPVPTSSSGREGLDAWFKDNVWPPVWNQLK